MFGFKKKRHGTIMVELIQEGVGTPMLMSTMPCTGLCGVGAHGLFTDGW